MQFFAQVGPNTPHNVAMTQLAAELLYRPAYEQLRTQEQLGYTVDVFAMQHGTVVGLGVLVSTAHDLDVVEARVRSFLASFEQRELPRMKRGEFEDARQNLLITKVCFARVLALQLECVLNTFGTRSLSSGPELATMGDQVVTGNGGHQCVWGYTRELCSVQAAFGATAVLSEWSMRGCLSPGRRCSVPRGGILSECMVSTCTGRHARPVTGAVKCALHVPRRQRHR